jgi:group I intron endonuclease
MTSEERKDIVSGKNYLYVHYIEDWTKPFYIGIGRKYRCFDFNTRNKYWKNYIKKHGTPNVKIISYYENYEDSKIAEKALIGFFGRRIAGNGSLLNITEGGDGTCGRIGELHPMYGKMHSKETKAKISSAVKGRNIGSKNPMYQKYGELNPFYGKRHTKEQKEYQSQLKKAMYTGIGNPFYGKRHSEETKEKISAAKVGISMNDSVKNKIAETLKIKRQNNPELWGFDKPWDWKASIILLDISTGVFYYSYRDAAKYYSFDRKYLRKLVRNQSSKINLREV